MLQTPRPSLLRLLRAALTVAAVVSFALPAALGPAMGALLQELGAQTTHVCKCGMKPGKCHCPECERLEHERARHPSSASPAFARGCGDESPLLVPTAARAVVPAGVCMLLLPSTPAAADVSAAPRLLSRDGEPPTPPPRIAPAC